MGQTSCAERVVLNCWTRIGAQLIQRRHFLSEGAQFFSEQIKAKSNTIPGIFLVMARSLALLLGFVAVLVDAQKFCPKERKGDKCKAKELG